MATIESNNAMFQEVFDMIPEKYRESNLNPLLGFFIHRNMYLLGMGSSLRSSLRTYSVDSSCFTIRGRF